MHRVAGSGLLALFLFVLGGTYPIQWALRQMARQEMRTLIQTHGAQLDGVIALSFPLVNGQVAERGFTWEEEGEFTYQGAMFDVIHSETAGDVITFQCVPDGREGDVVRSMKSLESTHDSGRSMSDPAGAFVKVICDQFVPPMVVGSTSPLASAVDLARHYNAALHSGFRRVPQLPPLVT